MNHTTMYYCIGDLVEYLQEIYDDSLVPYFNEKECSLHQKGQSLAYLDALNLFKERLAALMIAEDFELLKEAISELQNRFNQTKNAQPYETEEDAEIRAGKHFGYYDILNKIDLHLIVSFQFPRRLFDVIAPDLNNIDKKIDNTTTKPLPSRSELKEKLLLLLDNKISKEEIDAWARNWIIANPEAGKIEDGIVWEILNNFQLISYKSENSLREDIEEWFKLLEQN